MSRTKKILNEIKLSARMRFATSSLILLAMSAMIFLIGGINEINATREMENNREIELAIKLASKSHITATSKTMDEYTLLASDEFYSLIRGSGPEIRSVEIKDLEGNCIRCDHHSDMNGHVKKGTPLIASGRLIGSIRITYERDIFSEKWWQWTILLIISIATLTVVAYGVAHYSLARGLDFRNEMIKSTTECCARGRFQQSRWHFTRNAWDGRLTALNSALRDLLEAKGRLCRRIDSLLSTEPNFGRRVLYERIKEQALGPDEFLEEKKAENITSLSELYACILVLLALSINAAARVQFIGGFSTSVGLEIATLLVSHVVGFWISTRWTRNVEIQLSIYAICIVIVEFSAIQYLTEPASEYLIWIMTGAFSGAIFGIVIKLPAAQDGKSGPAIKLAGLRYRKFLLYAAIGAELITPILSLSLRAAFGVVAQIYLLCLFVVVAVWFILKPVQNSHFKLVNQQAYFLWPPTEMMLASIAVGYLSSSLLSQQGSTQDSLISYEAAYWLAWGIGATYAVRQYSHWHFRICGIWQISGAGMLLLAILLPNVTASSLVNVVAYFCLSVGWCRSYISGPPGSIPISLILMSIGAFAQWGV